MNFDAKARRNSTDLEDIFIGHISGMDVFARSLLIADEILNNSEYKKMKTQRYASFTSGKGADYVNGQLSLEDLRKIAKEAGEPAMTSGKQEWYEALINMYI